MGKQAADELLSWRKRFLQQRTEVDECALFVMVRDVDSRRHVCVCGVTRC